MSDPTDTAIKYGAKRETWFGAAKCPSPINVAVCQVKVKAADVVFAGGRSGTASAHGLRQPDVVVTADGCGVATVRRVVVKDPARRKMFQIVPTIASVELIRGSDEATNGGAKAFGRRRSL